MCLSTLASAILNISMKYFLKKDIKRNLRQNYKLQTDFDTTEQLKKLIKEMKEDEVVTDLINRVNIFKRMVWKQEQPLIKNLIKSYSFLCRPAAKDSQKYNLSQY